jgi:predicted HNH restriction endonuclease
MPKKKEASYRQSDKVRKAIEKRWSTDPNETDEEQSYDDESTIEGNLKGVTIMTGSKKIFV